MFCLLLVFTSYWPTVHADRLDYWPHNNLAGPCFTLCTSGWVYDVTISRVGSTHTTDSHWCYCHMCHFLAAVSLATWITAMRQFTTETRAASCWHLQYLHKKRRSCRTANESNPRKWGGKKVVLAVLKRGVGPLIPLHKRDVCAQATVQIETLFSVVRARRKRETLVSPRPVMFVLRRDVMGKHDTVSSLCPRGYNRDLGVKKGDDPVLLVCRPSWPKFSSR